MSSLDTIVNYNASPVWDGILFDSPQTTVNVVGSDGGGQPTVISTIVRYVSHILESVDLSGEFYANQGNVTLNSAYTDAADVATDKTLGVEFLSPISTVANEYDMEILPSQIPSWSRQPAAWQPVTPSVFRFNLQTIDNTDGFIAENWFTYRLTGLTTSAEPYLGPVDPSELTQYQSNRSRPLAVRTYKTVQMTTDSVALSGTTITVDFTINSWSKDIPITNGRLMLRPVGVDGSTFNTSFTEATNTGGTGNLEGLSTYSWQIDIASWPDPSQEQLASVQAYWIYDTAPYKITNPTFAATTTADYESGVIPSVQVSTLVVVVPVNHGSTRMYLIGDTLGDVVAVGETQFTTIDFNGQPLSPA